MVSCLKIIKKRIGNNGNSSLTLGKMSASTAGYLGSNPNYFPKISKKEVIV